MTQRGGYFNLTNPVTQGREVVSTLNSGIKDVLAKFTGRRKDSYLRIVGRRWLLNYF